MNIVAMRPQDRPYVVSTWGASSAYGLPRRLAYRLADRLLDDGVDVRCMVSGDAVHGWCASRAPLLHYVYVPPELRGNGFARQLIATSLGEYANRILTSHPWPGRNKRFRYESTGVLQDMLRNQ